MGYLRSRGHIHYDFNFAVVIDIHFDERRGDWVPAVAILMGDFEAQRPTVILRHDGMDQGRVRVRGQMMRLLGHFEPMVHHGTDLDRLADWGLQVPPPEKTDDDQVDGDNVGGGEEGGAPENGDSREGERDESEEAEQSNEKACVACAQVSKSCGGTNNGTKSKLIVFGMSRIMED